MLAAALLLGAAGQLDAARAQEGAGLGPAPTLAAPSSPTGAPDGEGFLRRWLLLEPIPVNGLLTDSAVRATVDNEYFPGQFTVLPEDGDSATVDGEELSWHAVDSTRYNVNLYHFARALERPTSNVLFWLVTVVDSPRELRDVRLAIGSNAASVWWLNGEEVIGIYDDRQTVIDDGVSKRLTLHAGLNVVRAAVVNAGGATDFCARFIDEAGDPVTGIRIILPNRGADAAQAEP
jgi:hypothetical protein